MKLSSTSLLLSCILLLAILSPLFGQTYLTNHFRSSDGLETDFVKCAIQDKYGFMWIGTDDGLFRYDGIGFTRYPDAASSKFFKSFLETGDGKLLAIHDLGITQIFPSLDSVQFADFIPGKRLLSDSTIWYPKYAIEDSNNNIWISEPQSIVKYHNGTWKRYLFGAECNTKSFVRSFVFHEINQDTLLIASNTGFFFTYSYKNDVISPVNIRGDRQTIYSVHEFSNLLLFGTENGLFSLVDSTLVQVPISANGDTPIAIKDIQTLTNNQLLIGAANMGAILCYNGNGFSLKSQLTPNMLVNKTYTALDKTVWLCTEKGVMVLKKPDFEDILLPDDNNYIEGMMSQSEDSLIYVLTKGSVWTINKSTNYRKRIFGHSTDDYFLSGAYTDKYFLASSGFDIIKFKNGIVVDRKNLSDYGRFIFALYTDKTGTTWIGQEASMGLKSIDPETLQVTVYNEEKGISGEVNAISETSYGILAVTSDPDHYVYYKKNSEDTFKDLSIPFSTPYRKGLTVDCVVEVNNMIWIGTNFGLFRLSDNQLEKVSINSDLDHSAVRELKADGESIWVGSTAGLYRINVNSQDYAHFKESSGLPVNTVNFESLIIEQNDVWVGTSQGIAKLSLNKNDELNKTHTPVILGFNANGKQKKTNQKIELEHNAHIEVSFSTLSYPSTDIQYSYQLNNDAWHPLQHEPTAIFNNLAEGSYELKVKAKRMGNFAWSDELTFPFTIKPPFYKTLPFYLAIITIFGFAIIGTRAITKKREENRQDILRSLVEERTRELNNIKDRLEELVLERTAELETTVSKLTETQNQLIQTEKMASLGVLTAGIAHEINNPVNYLKGGIYSLERLLTDLDMIKGNRIENEELQEVMTLMNQGVDRITHIVKGMGRYSRQGEQKITPCNIHDIISNSILILDYEIKSKAKMNLKFEADQSTIFGDEGTLHQLFVNLISNAIQAIAEFGKIDIKTYNPCPSKLSIEIIDTGHGIPQKALAKIFDPFFTTKPPGEGTGLGLFIVKKIINEHNGTIEYQSQPEVGTTVILTFNLQYHG